VQRKMWDTLSPKGERAEHKLGRLLLRAAPGACRSLHLPPCPHCSLGVFTAGSWLVEGLPLLIV
jgi:hypothetical protein